MSLILAALVTRPSDICVADGNLRGVGVSRVLRLVVQDVSIYAKINRILSLIVSYAYHK